MSKSADKAQAQELPGPRKPADSSVQGWQHPQQYQPRQMTPNMFQEYKSLQLKRLNNTFGRFKKSLPYLGGSLLLGWAFSLYFTGWSKYQLYGHNRNGGRWLTLYSRNSDYDMAYNREFQRNRYLGQNPIKTRDYLNSDQHLALLGIHKPNVAHTKGYDKRSPHPKYYY